MSIHPMRRQGVISAIAAVTLLTASSAAPANTRGKHAHAATSSSAIPASVRNSPDFKFITEAYKYDDYWFQRMDVNRYASYLAPSFQTVDTSGQRHSRTEALNQLYAIFVGMRARGVGGSATSHILNAAFYPNGEALFIVESTAHITYSSAAGTGSGDAVGIYTRDTWVRTQHGWLLQTQELLNDKPTLQNLSVQPNR